MTTRPELSARDRAVVELVGKFRQMTRGQIRASLFQALASPTPVDRTLKRLVERGYLARLARLVGGDRGGSAQYVYQLGRAGWKLLDRPGAYWAPRAVNLHALAVADCFVALKEAEQRGELEVISFTTELDCHEVVGQVRLTPDAYVELAVGGRKLISWLEVDRGTEHLGVIQEKCERYWKAFTSGQWDGVFPYVLFIVPDEQRLRAIERVVQAGPVEAHEIFRACLFKLFPVILPQK